MTPQRVAAGWAWPGEAAARDHLLGLGLRPGRRLALGGLDRPATAVLLAAALRLGLTVIPLNRRLTPEELRGLHARARADATLADPAHPLAAVVAAAPLPDYAGPTGPGGPLAGALTIFTSGTTGSAKAAHLGPAAITAAVAAHVAALGLTAADQWWLPLPLDHIGGAMGTLRALACGCTVALGAEPDAAATGASVVPTMLARLVAAGVRAPVRLRLALTGGGPLDPALAAAARALGWRVRETYGLTEMGSMVTLDGVPVPGAQVRIEDGRVQVAGPMLFSGYEGDAGLDPPSTWHATGDLGELVDGRLHIIGRVAELIVSGGENIAAPEVEAALLTHPQVAEACVVGLPDAQWGEVVAAAVVVRDGLAPATLDAWLRDRIAGFKRPRRWLAVEALPRTGLDKVQRAAVRRLFDV